MVKWRLAYVAVLVSRLVGLTILVLFLVIRLATPGTPEPTPRDLVGKSVGIQAGSEDFVTAMARLYGLDVASPYDQDEMAWTLYQWQGTGPWGGGC